MIVRGRNLCISTVAAVYAAMAWSHDYFQLVHAQELTATEIMQKIAETQQRLESISLRYRVDIGEGNFLVRTIAAKSPGLFFHDSSHGSPDLEPELDIDRQVVYVLEAEHVNFRPLSRMFHRRKFEPTDGLPGTLKGELFFVATGLWPLHGRRAPRVMEHALVLAEIATSPDFDFDEEMDQSDGCKCHRIIHISGRDRLWIDTEKGCSIIRRELYDEDCVSPASQFLLSEHREVAPGLWVPFCIRRVDYDTRIASRSAKQPSKTIDVTAHVEYVHINNVKDSVFLFRMPPGSLELESEGGSGRAEQRSEGGIDLLNEQATWIKRRMKLREKRAVGDSLPGIAAAVLVAGLLMWICFIMMRGRREKCRAA